MTVPFKIERRWNRLNPTRKSLMAGGQVPEFQDRLSFEGAGERAEFSPLAILVPEVIPMKRWLTVTGLILALTLVPSFAATGTWVGKIGDTMCGVKHKAMHGKKTDDRACTETCIAAGAKYNFVSKGKAYEISNQTFAGLASHAGHTVRLTGDMSTDGKSVAVTKITMPGLKKGQTKTKGY